MDRVTCFKLCYALGVSRSDIQKSYCLEYRVAFSDGAFKPTETLSKFRALAVLYNHIMRDYSRLKALDDFRPTLDEELPDFKQEFGTNPSSFCESSNILTAICLIAKLRNSMIGSAYNDLEIAINASDFITFCKLPKLDKNTVDRIHFVMSKTNHLYGLYFYGNDVFNVSIGSFLQNDFALKSRIELNLGYKIKRIVDKSSFGKSVDFYLEQVYVTNEKIQAIRNLYCFTCEYGDIVSRFSHVKRIDSISDIPSGSLVVTKNYSDIPELAEGYPNLNFGAMLPISSRHYYQWRRRKYPNVYLILRGDISSERL